ncbi:G-type lectin S-receptor-like serine/threonine-protein kinase [Zostera marina]|uniref:G-type lectin S-receptor-like serine/threonine-protein kinase n=1 Tax=Zostera marina TaxID=29655 RepID=A0A0K9PWS6_ZOSMR|nr:G-type lectin S-receptor-like serine/threonine-protein kinase [Zostera marina]
MLIFSEDGNLVLKEKNGKVVWSTGTANKGVVGIKLLPVGNIVLYDKKGAFIWQSFDYPTDTLMVGQSLTKNGPTKLVGRASPKDNSDGIYSFVLGSNGMNLFVSPVQSMVTVGALPPPPLLYSDDRFTVTQTPSNITFTNEPGFSFNDVPEFYELQLTPDTGGNFIVAQVKYNATLSILRLETSGNLIAYTYYDPVDTDAWERTFTYFSDEDGVLPGCALPSKCGDLGVCQDSMCVACPTEKGLVGWNATCMPPAPCTVGSGVEYYKVVGVEQFIPKFNDGVQMSLKKCAKKCSDECNCVGFFYWTESSRCWSAPVLGSLTSVSNSSHVAYIKK